MAPLVFPQPGPRPCVWVLLREHAGGSRWLYPGGTDPGASPVARDRRLGLPRFLWLMSFTKANRMNVPVTLTSRGHTKGTWETARDEPGITEEMLPAAHPRAGRCSCTDSHPQAATAVTMTMSAALYQEGFLRN